MNFKKFLNASVRLWRGLVPLDADPSRILRELDEASTLSMDTLLAIGVSLY